MLRLIGLVTLLLLLLGPLLKDAGQLNYDGLLPELVSLEQHAFTEILGSLHLVPDGPRP